MGIALKRDFFQLVGTTTEIDQARFNVITLTVGAAHIKDYLYRPNELTGYYFPLVTRIRAKVFVNTSFSKTLVKNLEFIDCRFNRCLFMGTIFENCRFTNCFFEDSNPHRIEFRNCFIDPRAFDKCLDRNYHQNIGVHLYQDLLRNSRQQSQPDFSDYSLFYFRKWQRYLWIKEVIAKGETSYADLLKVIQIALYFVFDVAAGSGMRLWRLFVSSSALVSSLVLVNWKFAQAFGLMQGNNRLESLSDAFYFTSITVTTLGYGDILPTNVYGRIAVSIEAMFGFVLLAILTSTIYRRITS